MRSSRSKSASEPTQRGGEQTHRELALIFTESFTCAIDAPAGAAFLLPPAIEAASSPVAPSVASARYSFLIARPKMTLRRPVSIPRSAREKTGSYALRHGGRVVESGMGPGRTDGGMDAPNSRASGISGSRDHLSQPRKIVSQVRNSREIQKITSFVFLRN